MKNTLKTVSLLLCLVLLCGVFAACGSEEKEPPKDDPKPSEGEEKPSDEKPSDEEDKEINPEADYPLNIVQKGSSEYVIIYPEEAGSDLVSAVQNMATALLKYTGAVVDYKSDLLLRGETVDKNAKEILVGHTNREESAVVYETLSVNDFKICGVGNKLVLCGGSVSSDTKSAQYFVQYMIKGNKNLSFGKTDGDYIFDESDIFVRRASYPVRTIAIGETKYQNVSILVPSGSAPDLYVAKILRAHIGANSGIDAKITENPEEATGLVVRIGEVTGQSAVIPDDADYAVAVTENGVNVLAENIIAYGPVIKALQYNVFDTSKYDLVMEKGKVFSGVSQPEATIERTGNYRVMFHNTWGYSIADYPAYDRPGLAAEYYALYDPDVIGLEETSTKWRNAAKVVFDFLKEEYTEVVFEGNGTGNPIFFKTAKFNLVGSGYQAERPGDKGTTYVVLEDKATGDVFAVANSHFAANTNAGEDPVLGNEYRMQDAQTLVNVVKFIREEYGPMVVITGGDYNSNMGSDPINILTVDNGFQSARSLAEVSSEISAHHSAWGMNKDYGFYPLSPKASGSAASAIDHIMIGAFANSVEVKTYAVTNDPMGSSLSDHIPQFIDFNLLELELLEMTVTEEPSGEKGFGALIPLT